jgi:hypothetical protein
MKLRLISNPADTGVGYELGAIVRRLVCGVLLINGLLISSNTAEAQNTITGAFEGLVSNSQTGGSIESATVEIINQETGVAVSLRTDSRGRFFQGYLLPGVYLIRVSMPGFQTREKLQRLKITYTGEVIPVPVSLDPATTVPSVSPTPVLTADDVDVRSSISTEDGRRSGAYSEDRIELIPLGSTTGVRSFDELALLMPGVAPPPETVGGVAGPGVGAGVGSAGQFSVNGLRSRGNNFTVDGSDNNDEDIGVRRQGFVSLIPQSIESVRDYQVITILAPAQYGRNIGGQVNAVSKSGGSRIHGTVYGMFNSSQLNAWNFFDSGVPDTVIPLLTATNQPVLLNGQAINVVNQTGGKDSYTLAQTGFTVGGPVTKGKLFYFLSGEGQFINASQEESFAVPTLEQRGAFGTGATGIFRNPFTSAAAASVPTSQNGAAVYSLFPFPNNPSGIYGKKTFTQVLPAGGRGRVFSGKLDDSFQLHDRLQTFTARYNFTDDWRQIPVTGGALFSTLKPRVRTNNVSLFLNSNLSATDAANPMFNQLRLSYGRTRLRFDEVRDQSFLIPSDTLPNSSFLLNARLRFNVTQPGSAGVANGGAVRFISPLAITSTVGSSTVEQELGPLGQVMIAGFSPLGVDVFNFPQSRVNNTYQVADEMTWNRNSHRYVFGFDIRRSELNSDLPRNARPLVTFTGAPRLIEQNGTLRLPVAGDLNPVIMPEDLAALGAASNFFLVLNTAGNDAGIDLRYYQLNFYAQDTWRVRHNLSLSYGLRYEYNTPVSETAGRIESTFNDPALNIAPGLRQFIAGRQRIYDPDLNNFAPRLGVAYSKDIFKKGRISVFRGGYGLFYDQILGAVVSQSRNVFPRFLTLNFGGLIASNTPVSLDMVNPSRTFLGTSTGALVSLETPGTLNQLNPSLPLGDLVNFLNLFFPTAVGATYPSRRLEMPMAHHYSFTFEQEINPNLVASLAYVGSRGQHLLRFTTPNGGPGSTIAPSSFSSFGLSTLAGTFSIPEFSGRVLTPARFVSGLGSISQFETSARSHYDSLQAQVRGRFARSLDYQAAYTYSSARDDVSDVFDLAGAYALPQDGHNLSAEWGPANFDVKNRFTYDLTYTASHLLEGPAKIFNRFRFGSTGQFFTGQPFTVNSIFDVNLDGNLTDRLNTTNGIVQTGNRAQPIALTTNNTLSLLAPFGQNGQVGRNSFRAGNVLELDLSVMRSFAVRSKRLDLRLDVFNFVNRSNFGVPVRTLEAAGFGKVTRTITPGRRMQLSVKYVF